MFPIGNLYRVCRAVRGTSILIYLQYAILLATSFSQTDAVPLDLPRSTTLCIGDWTVDPLTGELSRGQELVRLDAPSLRLLLCLAEHAGEVVTIDALLGQVRQGVAVSPDAVCQAIAALRHQLGDDPKRPTFIATVPRRGYRLIASVTSTPAVHAAAARIRAAEQDGTLPLLDAQARPARLLLMLCALLALVACLLAIPLFDLYGGAPHAADMVSPPAARANMPDVAVPGA